LPEDAGYFASSHDFGKDFISRLIDTDYLCAYRFGEDIGHVTPHR
jgi:hypothetical protein